MPAFDPNNVPGYREAVASEQKLRDLAFLDLPEWIGGRPVRPLNLILFNRLDAVGSPFVHGRTPRAGDVGIFLWIISPEWREIRTWRDRLAKYLFLRSVAKLPFLKTVSEIYSYIDDAFMDAPGGGGNKKTARKNYASWNAILIDDIAAAYHWTRKEIQEEPFKVLFQLRNRIYQRLNPKSAAFNKRSDRVLARFMADRNASRQAPAAQNPK